MNQAAAEVTDGGNPSPRGSAQIIPMPVNTRYRVRLEHVLNLIGLGLHLEEVARSTGLNRSTLYRMKAKYPEAFALAEAKRLETVETVCASALIMIILNPESRGKDVIKASVALAKLYSLGGFGCPDCRRV
ncbi:MAG: hypothetical protein AMXMBFR75_32420 [Candidatus Hinthialibacteria bacterium]